VILQSHHLSLAPSLDETGSTPGPDNIWDTSDQGHYLGDTTIGLHVKYRSLLSDINEAWIFLADFRELLKYQIWRKSAQWEPSCSMRTDMTKQTVAYRNSANAPKIRRVNRVPVYYIIISFFISMSECLTDLSHCNNNNNNNKLLCSLHCVTSYKILSSVRPPPQCYWVLRFLGAFEKISKSDC
jgi:hypothetical protein